MKNIQRLVSIMAVITATIGGISAAEAAGVPTCTLSANSDHIAYGGSSALSWTSTDALSASISFLGTVPVRGVTDVRPEVTTTYTLVVVGDGGTATCTRTVFVSNMTPQYVAQPQTSHTNAYTVGNAQYQYGYNYGSNHSTGTYTNYAPAYYSNNSYPVSGGYYTSVMSNGASTYTPQYPYEYTSASYAAYAYTTPTSRAPSPVSYVGNGAESTVRAAAPVYAYAHTGNDSRHYGTPFGSRPAPVYEAYSGRAVRNSVPLSRVPYTGAEDYMMPLFALALASSGVYMLRSVKVLS